MMMMSRTGLEIYFEKIKKREGGGRIIIASKREEIKIFVF